MDLRIRQNEGQDPQNALQWDSVWDPAAGVATWAVAGPNETGNRGGLRATSAIETAVILALFTDRRVPDDHPLRYLADGDPRGWWGDGIDVRSEIGEEPLGSLLWLLERAPLTSDIVERWAPAMVNEALAPLLRQGVVVRIEVETAANELQSRLEILIRLYGRDGVLVFDRRFEVLWNQLSR